jgi:hypothetical protein
MRWLIPPSLTLSLLALAACDHSTYVLLHVDAAAGVAPVYQLQVTATLSSATSRFNQPLSVGAPLTLPKSLSLELPPGKSGDLMLQIAGLDQMSGAVALTTATLHVRAGQSIESSVVIAAQDMSCGVVGTPCCANVFCNGSSCVSGSCVACGAAHQVCCPGDLCPGGGQCVSGVCQQQPSQACGQVGQSCCADGSCASASLACVFGLCAPPSARCGQAGQPCCNGNTCSSSTLACVSGTCSSGCGQPNQPCCPGNVCETVAGRPLECIAGTCGDALCGTKNNVCCPGQQCQSTATQQLVCYTAECVDPICVAQPNNPACF